ncbi:PD-(D/E)XK nuclease-like domain-containing protein [Sphingomonas sp.]|jgi:hypothetical protein|uniref:PD-(D/E)XK nuclease-like domain-containing protein n=1 Tax=Sphingomonas sp. TaxID=28214 RepID=UPI0035612A5C
MQPGLHNLDAETYHADPAPKVSLSASILKIVLSESLLHAWHAHPKLNPNWKPNTSRAAEIGSVAHKLALGVGADVQIIAAENYRTKAAQEARDAAQAARKIPCLQSDYADAESLATPLREALEDYLGAHVADCLVEHSFVWQENGMWRRAMLDIVTRDLMRAADLKTSTASVAPMAAARRIYDSNYHIQAGFYLRGLDALDPDNVGRRTFGFVFGEQNEPHAVSPPIELSEAGLEMARQQIDVGVALWDHALRTNVWPGYSTDILIAEPPSWALTQWQTRYETDESLNPRVDGPRELRKLDILTGAMS